MVEDDDCCGICSICDNAIEHNEPIKRKDRVRDDEREKRRADGCW